MMSVTLDCDKAIADRHSNDPFGILLAVLLLSFLVGCGGQPMPFPAPESELGNRPGLLTGETGAWDVLPSGSSRQQPR